jgi:hypothetical protein
MIVQELLSHHFTKSVKPIEPIEPIYPIEPSHASLVV